MLPLWRHQAVLTRRHAPHTVCSSLLTPDPQGARQVKHVLAPALPYTPRQLNKQMRT